MKYAWTLAICLAVLCLAAPSGAAPQKALRDAHVDLACADCHTGQKNPKQAGAVSCAKCHDAPEVAKRTASRGKKILIFLRTGERRFLVGSATRNTPKIRITASSAIRGDAGPHYTVHGNLISVRNGTTPEEIARGLGWPPLVFPAKISHPQAPGGCLCPAPRPRSPLRPILKKKAN